MALEIGFGMGEATAEMAAARPDLDLLAVDVHTPGQGALLRRVDELGLTNVRVADGDALVLLREMVAPASLAEVRVFFPDPWPKRRHWKRRLLARGRGAEDTAEVIEHRIRVYLERTRPLLDYYAQREQLVTVNGARPMDEVTWSLDVQLQRVQRRLPT